MRELPEPYGYFDIRGSAADGFTRDQVLAIQRQAYEDGLRDAMPSVDDLAQIIRCVDGNNSLGAGQLAEQILAMLTASQKEPQ